jgi:hypothetical protein
MFQVVPVAGVSPVTGDEIHFHPWLLLCYFITAINIAPAARLGIRLFSVGMIMIRLGIMLFPAISIFLFLDLMSLWRFQLCIQSWKQRSCIRRNKNTKINANKPQNMSELNSQISVRDALYSDRSAYPHFSYRKFRTHTALSYCYQRTLNRKWVGVI